MSYEVYLGSNNEIISTREVSHYKSNNTLVSIFTGLTKGIQTQFQTSHYNFCITNDNFLKWSKFGEVYLENSGEYLRNFNGFFIMRSLSTTVKKYRCFVYTCPRTTKEFL